MSVDYMSSENSESDSEINEERLKVLVKRKFPWQSDDINKLMAFLDHTIKRSQGPSRNQHMIFACREGAASTRPAPIDAPA